MAITFAPDIGMDIGPSNMPEQKGIAADFSGVGRAIGNLFAPPKVTAEDRKAAVLDQTGMALAEVSQITDQVERSVRANKLIAQFSTNYGEYRTDIIGQAETILGKNYSALDPMVREDTNLSAYLETPSGQATSSWAMVRNLKDDGSFDSEGYATDMRTSSARYFATNAAVTEAETNQKLRGYDFNQSFYGNRVVNENGVPTYEGGLLDSLGTNADETIKKLKAPELVDKAMANPTPENLGYATAMVTDAKNAWLASANEAVIRLGGNPSDPAVKESIAVKAAAFDSVLSGISNMNNIEKETTARYTAMGEQLNAKLKLKQTAYNSAIAQALIDKKLPVTEEAIKTMSVTSIGLLGAEDVNGVTEKAAAYLSSWNKNPLINSSSPIGLPSTTTNFGEQGVTDVTSPYSEEDLKTVTSMPKQQQMDAVKFAGTWHSNWNSVVPADVPKLLDSSISGMIAAGQEVAPINSGALSAFTGKTGMFEMASAISGTPDGTARLLPNMDGFLTDQATKNFNNINLLNNLTSKNGNSWFLHSLENGKYTIKVNPAAYQEDVKLQQLVKEAGGSTDGRVILTNRLASNTLKTMIGETQIDPTKILDSMKSLELISSGLNKMSPASRKALGNLNVTLETNIKSLSAFTPKSQSEKVLGVASAKGDFPAEWLKYEPLMAEYIMVQNEMKAGNKDPNLNARLTAIAAQMPEVPVSLSNGGIVSKFVNYINKKTEAGQEVTPSNTPVEPIMNPLTSTTPAPTEVRRIKFSDIFGNQAGASK